MAAAPGQPSRLRPLWEAAVPVLGIQAWVWLAGHPRSRLGDVALGLGVLVWILAAARSSGPPLAAAWNKASGEAPAQNVHRAAALPVAVWTATMLLLLLAYGHWTDTLLWRPAPLAKALLGYPFSGLLQQGLMFAFVAPRLGRLVPAPYVPLCLAAVFCLAHLPNPLLMLGGGLMTYGFARIWAKTPSLLLLALSHGILGAVCDKALDVSMRVGAGY